MALESAPEADDSANIFDSTYLSTESIDRDERTNAVVDRDRATPKDLGISWTKYPLPLEIDDLGF
jgi:hypothetical protein